VVNALAQGRISVYSVTVLLVLYKIKYFCFLAVKEPEHEAAKKTK